MSHQEKNDERKCNACPKPISAEGEVTCNNCMSEYHYWPCAGVKETSYLGWNKTKKNEWKCTSCKMRTRTTSASSSHELNTQKRTRENEEGNEEEVNKIKQKRSENNDLNLSNDIKEIKNMLKDMNQKNNDLKNDMTINFNLLNKTISDLMIQVADLTKQNKEKDNKITKLEIRINEIEQQTLQNNIEISNIPQEEKEKIDEIVIDIAQSIDVSITKNDIAEVYRNHKKNIILKLNNKIKKKEIMQNAKKKPIVNKENKKIYFNDQLTASNKKLLWLARTAAKLNEWKFTWVKEGRIYTKKNEESNIIYIREESNINSIS